MNKVEKIGTYNGIVIYNYDFTNKQGIKVKTTKALFSINGLPVYVVSSKLNDKKMGSTIVMDLGYDGSKWVII